MKNIYLFELSDVFANQVYLPYSSGVVWSYLKTNKEINKQYKLQDWFFAREDATSIISKIKNPDILLFSCFIWNWNLNCEIAKTIKEKYPHCLIICGGQHQPLPDRNKNFFKEYFYIDILIHHEGELTLEEILLRPDDLQNIKGITLNLNKEEFRTPPRKRLEEIKDTPSPYLDGSFNWIIEKNKKENNYAFNATVESARGCPYSCSFCEIGEEYYQKIKTSYDKTKKEIEWIAKNKIEYITDANSNFGIMFKHDYDLAQYIVKVKEKYKYPHAYRATWAKGQADKVLQIAKLFEKADIQKGMTIALQSMNSKVLKAIKRKNIDGGKLREFVQTYEKENISSYVELIWGLPEETLDSFINGITYIMEEGYHNYLDIHLMMLLPNAPISEIGYKEHYGLKTLAIQPRFSHRSNPEQLVKDTVNFVVEANSFTKDDWIEGHQFRWIIIFGHYLGTLQFIARGLKKIYNLSYKEFYTKLLIAAKEYPQSYLGKEYWVIKNNLNEILKNKRHWGDIIKGAGDINWEVDEASAIRLTKNKDTFYKEIKDYLIQEYTFIDMKVLDELFKYQLCRLHNPFRKYPFIKKFKYNIHEVIEKEAKLELKNNKLLFEGKNFNSNLYEWAKETLWFGRRVARYKTRATVL